MNETIVLIHGYGFDSRIWLPVEIAFEGYRVVYLTLPGFGDAAAKERYTIESLAKHFWTELDRGPSGTVHLVGHSMGGYVCLEMAAQEPSRVASLALIHSHVFADSEEKKNQRSATIEHIKAHGRDAVVRKMIPSLFAQAAGYPELINALISRGLGFDDRAWIFGAGAMRDRKDHSETLKNIHVPVLMISGDKDSAVPVEWIYAQASLPENNFLVIYPGVGHMAMYENTLQLICDLRSFYTPLMDDKL
jgi:pimeloyl-ACP methyl ester carboxylesterase